MLALGLLAGIDGAAGSAGREKIRAVAASLAEQDQERMRAMRAVDLPEHSRSWTTNVGGVDYTVVSEVDWVSDTSAAQVSCTSTGGKADLLRLRTTVTSARTGTTTAAVRISSLLAPPIGSAGGANGTLAVALENRDGAAVVGLPVTITATDGSYSATKVTNALGCALFTYIPADTYDVAVNVSPYVDPDGTQSVVAADVTVAAGELSTKELQYDRGLWRRRRRLGAPASRCPASDRDGRCRRGARGRARRRSGSRCASASSTGSPGDRRNRSASVSPSRYSRTR